jgi:hypothetical protein
LEQYISYLKSKKEYNVAYQALGKPGETFGVGRILVDDDSWQSATPELMRDSSLIICVPSSRPGSKNELDQIIRTDYRTKTVFIMPPSAAFVGGGP